MKTYLEKLGPIAIGIVIAGLWLNGCAKGCSSERANPEAVECYQQILTDSDFAFNAAKSKIALGDFQGAQEIIDHGKIEWPDDDRFTRLKVP